jgi:phosphatidylserine decarboxylase
LRSAALEPFFAKMSLSTDHGPEASIATLHGDVVRYRNRQSGELIVERAPGLGLLHWLYCTRPGGLCLRLLVRYQLFSDLYGWWQKRSFTRRNIRAFVERYGIDLAELELPLERYSNFNNFFTRRLKSEARPFATAPEVFCSPADGKVLVYPHLAKGALLPIKGGVISINALLGQITDLESYLGGAALVVRLAPYDYHRFHFTDDGEVTETRSLAGYYHSVNPLALEKMPEIFCLNKRSICQLHSPNFGRMTIVEVGALNVSSIVQTHAIGPVTRGQEKGYFQFGGSTVILLFGAASVVFDADLIADSATGLEVHVRTGERLGCHA